MLLLLAIGLLLAVSVRRRLRKEIVSSQLLFETKDELIRPPSIPEALPPSIKLPELVEEKSELIELLQTLQTQEVIQKKLHLLDSQIIRACKRRSTN